MESLQKVQQLKEELDNFRPLKPEAEARIMQKFRLDWNYHSNNIEGNSLTYGETKAFILFGITAGKKPFKDYLEIKGHNEAINWVLSLVKGETELTEVFIRELHTLLLKESSESFALTPDGKPTTKKIEVGKYKTLPNHVLTATGEMFYFASPEETPAKMHELINWYRDEREKPDVNPIILATLFHYRFIRIHPFDDGNGRTARILMNFILMQNGFPPVIIKTEDKENYYGVLRLADVGELEPFIEYIANNLIYSLEIMIKGAKGDDIEEPDDLDKKLAILDAKLEKGDKKAEQLKTEEQIRKIFNKSGKRLIELFLSNSEKFDRFYVVTDISISFVVYENGFPETRYKPLKTQKEIFPFLEKIINTFKEKLYSIRISYHFKQFNRINFKNFKFTSKILFRFPQREFAIKSENGNITILKHYLDSLTEDEIQRIVKSEMDYHYSKIEQHLLEK